MAPPRRAAGTRWPQAVLAELQRRDLARRPGDVDEFENLAGRGVRAQRGGPRGAGRHSATDGSSEAWPLDGLAADVDRLLGRRQDA